MKTIAAFAATLWLSSASAAPAAPATIVVDGASGAVLQQDQAGQPRHPASLTKMMTLYMAFQAIAQGRATADAKLTVSDAAAGQGGSVLGLREGAVISLSDAMTSLVVRSANDAAVAIAEHLAGSEAAFARRMTEQARALGMNATTFLNATGLTAPGHVTTARDMAMLGLALKRDFPQHWRLFSTTSMQWNKKTLPTVNGFVASYPGAEGLKTGFTCPAGYNLAAAASRQGRSAIAVILGATGKDQRLSLAATLMTRALAASPHEPVAQLANLGGAPVDMSGQVCVGGILPGERAAPQALPPGWGLEVAFGRDEAPVRAALARSHKALAKSLGGGKSAVTIKPFNGGLRYRGLIVGLSEDKAVSTCRHLRAEAGEDACLVLPPQAVEGAAEVEKRWRLLSAR